MSQGSILFIMGIICLLINASPARADYKGVVRDSATSAPLESVKVLQKGTMNQVYTNTQGQFVITPVSIQRKDGFISKSSPLLFDPSSRSLTWSEDYTVAIFLYNVRGMVEARSETHVGAGTYVLPYLSDGVHILDVKVDGDFFREKIVVVGNAAAMFLPTNKISGEVGKAAASVDTLLFIKSGYTPKQLTVADGDTAVIIMITQESLYVSGSLQDIQGARVLVLKGTHAVRGYTHGCLAGAQVMDVFSNFFVAKYFRDSDSLYAVGRAFAAQQMLYQTDYVKEATALVNGMVAAGANIFQPVLGRNIDSLDILMLNSKEELVSVVGYNFGCSSLASWGSATQNDSLLNGGLVVTRFWDWTPYPAMVNNVLMVVHCPAETDERNWVSAEWAGTLGACTGVATDQLGTFLNYGNNGGSYLSKANPGPYRAVSLALRDAVEQRDYNADGQTSGDDVLAALRAGPTGFSSIIQVVTGDSAFVVELDNSYGLRVRTPAHNPTHMGQSLIATNHFRLLVAPLPCDRYQKLTDSLTADPTMTRQRSWDLLTQAAGTGWSVYKIQYQPTLGSIWWAPAVEGLGAAWRPYVVLTLAQLFAL
jgi:hypothetical protein